LRVAFVGVQTTELLTFRGPMLRAMAAEGHTVLAIAPEDDARVKAALDEIGVRFATMPLHRAGMNPVRDSLAVVSLARTLRRFGPDAILVTAAKPVIYGSVAARLAGVPLRAAMITGVGSALGGGSGSRRRVLARLVRLLYSIGLRQAHVVFFQNADDESLFRDLGLVGKRHRLVRIAGSGIDLDAFQPTPLPAGPVTFLMVARLLWDKGVREFVDAARAVHQLRPDVRFQILGPLDPNPSAVASAELDTIRAEGVVEYLGETDDVRPYLAAAHVATLPSYREGTPRSLLEAMAMGRPVLTTDVPGCRETVQPGRNGLTVAARDSQALADGMLELIDQSGRLEAMGLESRRIAEERFDVRVVNRTILGAMGLARAEPADTAF
jgi:glycosyltransferase involved in cell wall biosynthesis